MDQYEIAERFADMWRTSRAIAGKSQDYMAKALGVSKKTIQNWEDGTSSPSQIKGLEWFQVLGLQPLPFYLRVIHPEQFGGLTPNSADEEIEEALFTCLHEFTPDFRRKLLFVLLGDHGSSPIAVMDMIAAHLHTPLRDRLNVAESIRTNYQIAEANKTLVCPTHVPSDIQSLSYAIDCAKAAIITSQTRYASFFYSGGAEE